MTNLLRNDDHYRGIARLWHAWSRLPALRVPSPRELYVRHQNLRNGFDAWCMLLVVRACSQLRLDPAEDEGWESEIRPGCSIRLDGGFRIAWEGDGSIILADEDRIVARFVPVVHALERARTRKAANARIDSLAGEVADAAHWTVILHPAVPGKPPHDALAGIGNLPDPSMSGAIDFMRVSPFSLDSVERVSRAIRWATLAPRMLAYPPTLRAIREPDMANVTRQGSWRADRGGISWAMVRPPRPDELSGLNIEGRLKKARSDRDDLVQRQKEVQEELKKVRDDRRRMAGLNREKSRLLQPVREATDAVDRLEDFERQLESACRNVTALAACPVCGGTEVDFAPRENDCFAARCRSTSCDTRWELRHDPETRSRIPVLLPSDTSLGSWPDDVGPRQWVDDILGCDVLAVPTNLSPGVVTASISFHREPSNSKIRRGRCSLPGNDQDDPNTRTRLSPATSQSCLARPVRFRLRLRILGCATALRVRTGRLSGIQERLSSMRDTLPCILASEPHKRRPRASATRGRRSPRWSRGSSTRLMRRPVPGPLQFGMTLVKWRPIGGRSSSISDN